MKDIDNVTVSDRVTRGLLDGALGVLIFSGTMTATRAAAPALGGLFTGLGRGAVAAGLAGVWLIAARAERPRRAEWPGLIVVALGAVIGFPLLSSLAMTRLPATHGMVVTAVMPMLTALGAVLRAGERTTPRFWAWSGAATAIVVAWALHAGLGRPDPADLLLLVAMLAAAASYTEGGRLSRARGGLWVLSWALVIAAPITLPGALALLPDAPAPPSAWAGFAWISLMSSFVGFTFWYRGLAEGGIARVSQVQVVQPLLGLLWAQLLLREPLDPWAILAAVAVVGCVWRGLQVAREVPPRLSQPQTWRTS